MHRSARTETCRCSISRNRLSVVNQLISATASARWLYAASPVSQLVSGILASSASRARELEQQEEDTRTPRCGQRTVTYRSGHDRGEGLEQGRRLILDIGLDGQRGVIGTGLLRGLESQLQLVSGSWSFLVLAGLEIFLAGCKPGDRERLRGTNHDRLGHGLTRPHAAEVDDRRGDSHRALDVAHDRDWNRGAALVVGQERDLILEIAVGNSGLKRRGERIVDLGVRRA